MLELEATNTHLYPGATGTILSGEPVSGPVTLRFADGGGAAGTLSGEVLHTAPYTTAAGTGITAKSWQIAFDGDRFRITARAAP
ncbi:MAG: hypothetical protein RIA08_13055 [Roseovarius sp.]|uniref:hypothetical protein n=1 Tax=Roseovarius sp. TaxID=1486281 RepID=UPI0032EB5D91